MNKTPNLADSDKRIEEAEARTDQANTRTQQAEARADHANTRTGEANTRTDEANIRTQQAETRTGQAEQQSNRAQIRTDQADLRTDQANLRTKEANTRTEEANVRTDQAENREHAMRASELSYRRLFEAARDGILILDVDTGRISDVNPFLVELLGFSHGEMVGKTVGELSPFKDIVSNQAMLNRLQKDGHIRYENLPLETKDGRHIAVEFVSNVYQAGVLKVIQCNIRDITERRKSEQQLNLLNTCVSRLNDIVLVTEADPIDEPGPRIVFVNQAFERLTGYTSAETLGRSPRFLQGENTDRPILAEISQALKHQEPIRRQLVNYGKDGNQYLLEMDMVPIFNDVGKCTHFAAIERDITERTRIEKALRESEARFRFLNDLTAATRALANPVRIMAVKARMLGEHLRASRCAYADVEQDGEHFTILHDYTDGCVSTVGKYQLSLFGARAVETLNSGQTLIIRDMDAELAAGEGAEMFNAIDIKAIITWPLVKEGRLRAMMAVHQTTPRNWKSDEIAIVKDVAERCWATIERRIAEEKIQQLNAGLEQRVIERTAQLEAANKELEAFSYSVSHDLRAPLRAVHGLTRIVMQKFAPQLPADMNHYLERIRDCGQQMGVLIDDLLAFSRLGRQSLKRQQVSTAKLVQDVLAEFTTQREDRRIEMQTGTLPDCWGDRALLKQVWVNLLSNAIKYTRGREPAVIEIGCVADNGEDVFFVRDNGTGFDMQYADKLFGVFQRLHLAEDFEGTGVGLAIVQRIIHRHGGRVWAEAELGRGATFRFTLAPKKQS
ncbi:MAG: hypothetical protein JWQ71_2636 [Pedosphaera sp.]|nr:hypothetical protein [Pedosphaera sp.]